MSTHPLLKVEIVHLSISERIQLAEDLWDSILENSEQLPITDVQHQELERYNQNSTLGTDWDTVESRLRLRS